MRFKRSKFNISSRYVLFGPPGIGKSTTIKWLRRAGYAALDLETIPFSQWDDAISDASIQFIGAAAVHPSVTLPAGTFKVLLYAPQSRYDKRRAYRDQSDPTKANQRVHTIAEWREFNWDVCVNNSYGDYDTWWAMLSKFLNDIRKFERTI